MSNASRNMTRGAFAQEAGGAGWIVASAPLAQIVPVHHSSPGQGTNENIPIGHHVGTTIRKGHPCFRLCNQHSSFNNIKGGDQGVYNQSDRNTVFSYADGLHPRQDFAVLGVTIEDTTSIHENIYTKQTNKKVAYTGAGAVTMISNCQDPVCAGDVISARLPMHVNGEWEQFYGEGHCADGTYPVILYREPADRTLESDPVFDIEGSMDAHRKQLTCNVDNFTTLQHKVRSHIDTIFHNAKLSEMMGLLQILRSSSVINGAGDTSIENVTNKIAEDLHIILSYFYDEPNEELLVTHPRVDYHCFMLVHMMYTWCVLEGTAQYDLGDIAAISKTYTLSCLADTLSATVAAYHVMSTRKNKVHVLGYALDDAKARCPIRIMLTPCR
jgi:hypothetical protein